MVRVKQTQHIRHYRSGRTTPVNIGFHKRFKHKRQELDPLDPYKIVPTKKYGEQILIQDKSGKRYSTKNIDYIGARTLFDGDDIHGRDAKPDLILDYDIED